MEIEKVFPSARKSVSSNSNEDFLKQKLPVNGFPVQELVEIESICFPPAENSYWELLCKSVLRCVFVWEFEAFCIVQPQLRKRIALLTAEEH